SPTQGIPKLMPGKTKRAHPRHRLEVLGVQCQSLLEQLLRFAKEAGISSFSSFLKVDCSQASSTPGVLRVVTNILLKSGHVEFSSRPRGRSCLLKRPLRLFQLFLFMRMRTMKDNPGASRKKQ